MAVWFFVLKSSKYFSDFNPNGGIASVIGFAYTCKKTNDRFIFMKKGEKTRVEIVEAALSIAHRHGLEGLTIGAIAEKIGKSKSGVFAHFGSREELQIAVLREYEQRFVQTVLLPSLEAERGLPRLQALFMRWLGRVALEVNSGCIYISGASEFDDRPGAVRETLVKMHVDWQKEMVRAVEQAVAQQHLPASTHVEQLVFEMSGLVLAAHQQRRLLGDALSVERAQEGFARLVLFYQMQEQYLTKKFDRKKETFV
jgi:AcrR family transcriptional regulator